MAMPKGLEGKVQVMRIVDGAMYVVASDPESTVRTAEFSNKIIDFVSAYADGNLSNAEVVAALSITLTWIAYNAIGEDGRTAPEIMNGNGVAHA